MRVDIEVDESFRDSESASVGCELGGEGDRGVELQSAADNGDREEVGDDEAGSIISVRGAEVAGGGSGMGGKVYASHGCVVVVTTGAGGGVYRPAVDKANDFQIFQEIGRVISGGRSESASTFTRELLARKVVR